MAAGTGQAPGTYDLAGETPAARVLRAVGRTGGVYQLAGFRARGADEQATRDAMAAELRAIRIQTQRAEATTRQAALRSRAREALGLGVVGGNLAGDDGAGSRAANVTPPVNPASQRRSRLMETLGLGSLGRATAGRLGVRLPAGAGTAVGAVAIAEVAGRTGNLILDYLETEAYTPEREAMKVSGRRVLESVPGAGTVAGLANRAADYVPDVVNPYSYVSRLIGVQTGREVREFDREMKAAEERLSRGELQIKQARERREAVVDALAKFDDATRRTVMSKTVRTENEAELLTARQALMQFDRERNITKAEDVKRLIAEEMELRGKMLAQVRDLEDAVLADRLVAEQRIAEERSERERVFNRQQAQSRADSVREQGRRVQLAERRVAMERLGLTENRLQSVQDRQAAVSGTLEAVRNAGPMYVGNNLAGDVGAMVGIQSTGMSQNNAMLNRLADLNARQERQLEELNRQVRELVSNLERITVED